MAYSTQTEVQQSAGGADKLRQLSDFEGTNAINATVVANAIEAADAFINGYIKKVYAIPVSPVPASLKWESARFAVFMMAQDRGMVSDRMMELHNQRLIWLKDIADGLVVMDESEDPENSQFVEARVVPRSVSKDVSRDKLKGYW